MSSAALEFNAERHEYRLHDRIVPSVTRILRATGYSEDFEAIAALSRRRGEAIHRKRQIGSVLHADCHAFDDDDIEIDLVEPAVRPYLDAWMTFRENSRVVPLCRERFVYYGQPVGGIVRHEYCGTLDGIFLTPKRRRVLIDIKTGDPRSSGCQFQTAGYQMAYEFEHPERIDERWAVQLTPGCTVPYRVTPYTDWNDRLEWRRILIKFYESPNHAEGDNVASEHARI